jgi:hypothetical protein
MSKLTARAWRKEQTARYHERKQTEARDKERRLKGFKPASVGDMLTEINSTEENVVDRLAVALVRAWPAH